MAKVQARTTVSLDKSRALFKQISQYVAGGESNYIRLKAGLELCFDHGEGSRFWDVDGNSYIDYSLGYGPLIFGHKPVAVNEAVWDMVSTRGIQFTFPYNTELEVARTIVENIPGVDLIRFCTTGTEAVTAAIRLARAYTKRDKVLKFEGQYHGWTDTMYVSYHPSPEQAGDEMSPRPIPSSTGTPKVAAELIVPCTWNNLEAVERAFQAHPGEIAAILTEPVMCNCGVIPPEPGYLQGLIDLAHKYGAVMILDEVKTGFRLGIGGGAEYYGVKPDLFTWAKALGGGYPVAAFGGHREIMGLEERNEVMHGGTYNAHSVAMAAANAVLGIMTSNPGMFADIWEKGERLREGLQRVTRDAGHKSLAQGVGPLCQLYFTKDDVEALRNFREVEAHCDYEKFSRFQGALQDRGVYIHPDPLECFYICTAHSDEDIEYTIDAAADAAQAI